ncbi:MAG: hypothetical protein II010_02455, partial [Oscillospiraceae bacterium]|nr:hypothetical protein [Oscillospiraceae bacterium]
SEAIFASLCWALLQAHFSGSELGGWANSSLYGLLSIPKPGIDPYQSTSAKAFLFLACNTVFLFKKEKNGVASVSLSTVDKGTRPGGQNTPHCTPERETYPWPQQLYKRKKSRIVFDARLFIKRFPVSCRGLPAP